MTARIWRWGDDFGPLQEHLSRGGVVGLPTESSYALGVDPLHPQGVAQVARIKLRDPEKAMPIVVANVEQAIALGIEPTSPGLHEVARHWPAALSIALPLTREVPAAGSEKSLAIRIPAHARLRGLLAQLGAGLTATSANLSGEPPIIETDRLLQLLREQHAWVIDDGTLPGGQPSTLVRWCGDKFALLRQGRYSFQLLEEGQRIQKT